MIIPTMLKMFRHFEWVNQQYGGYGKYIVTIYEMVITCKYNGISNLWGNTSGISNRGYLMIGETMGISNLWGSDGVDMI